jgi:hypothetical protein
MKQNDKVIVHQVEKLRKSIRFSKQRTKTLIHRDQIEGEKKKRESVDLPGFESCMARKIRRAFLLVVGAANSKVRI